MKRLIVFLACIFFYQPLFACNYCYPEWAMLVYYGKMTNDNLGQIIVGNFTLNTTTLYSIELSKELAPCNPFRRYFQPIMSSVDLRANITYLDDPCGAIYQFNPYFTFNWYHFPWCHTLTTVVSIGEGLSYVTRVPYAEAQNSDQQKKLLNFLIFDIGFSLPCAPKWQMVLRMHHRSGAFGLYHANNSGSTAVGLGLRYLF